jgi:hypothetical protein
MILLFSHMSLESDYIITVDKKNIMTLMQEQVVN